MIISTLCPTKHRTGAKVIQKLTGESGDAENPYQSEQFVGYAATQEDIPEGPRLDAIQALLFKERTVEQEILQSEKLPRLIEYTKEESTKGEVKEDTKTLSRAAEVTAAESAIAELQVITEIPEKGITPIAGALIVGWGIAAEALAGACGIPWAQKE